MATYPYLTDNSLALQSIWAWAKRLVAELNKRDAVIRIMGVPTGARMMWFSDTAPSGWLICDGGLVTKASYPALFMAIGYRYGGSGDNFNVPDFRDKILMGAGLLVGLEEEAGSDTVTLTVDNLPAHAHTVVDPGHGHHFTGTPHTHGLPAKGVIDSLDDVDATSSDTAEFKAVQDSTAPQTSDAATAGGTVGSSTTGITIGETGEDVPVNILPPVYGQNVIIKV